MKKALYKVPNGKLLKIFVEEAGGIITSLRITGDFFIYPETRIEEAEQAMRGCAMNAEALTQRLEDFFAKAPAEFFGLDIPSLVHTIISAQ